MRRKHLSRTAVASALTSAICLANASAAALNWDTVVNNADLAPGVGNMQFFSYNQPSIDGAGLVAFRARARASGPGQGEPMSGIFTREMSMVGSLIDALAVRGGELPYPNNIANPGPATFNEFPSFPRVDANSGTLAFPGQSTPSWVSTLPDGSETRSGTSGLYVTPGGGSLVTGIRNIVPNDFPHFLVPNQPVPTKFDQFPGSPSPDGNIVTFKGNWADSSGVGQTGVYFRDMVANGGIAPVVKVAERGMAIPTNAIPGGGSAVFGSTSPPSAAGGKMAFTGLDVEEAPTAGGIFVAPMQANPTLTTVAGFNTVVPKNGSQTLTAFGEGLSFDGRHVGFWGGWGTETFAREVRCASDGNAAVTQHCLDHDFNGQAGDGIYTFNVLKNQGIFLADTQTSQLYLVAQTGDQFDDFLFWTYSGNAGQGGGEESEEEEGARWRSGAFVAIDGNDVVFKAAQGYEPGQSGGQQGGESGLFGMLNVSGASSDADLFTILTTGMNGGVLDVNAEGLPINALGIERDGFRNGKLAIAASMGTEESGWAGIYVGAVPEPSTYAMMALGLGVVAGLARRCRAG